MSTLLAETQALLDTDEPTDFQAIQLLADRIREEGPALPPRDGRALLSLVQQLEQKTRAKHTEAGQALRGVHHKKRALRGYAHLKSTTRAQRANRMA